MPTTPPPELVDVLADAVRTAVGRLFVEHAGERFYYCALITWGEASAPSLCAWSTEALDRAVARARGEGALEDADTLRELLKWSYADSPYFPYAADLFQAVHAAWPTRPALDPDNPDLDGWDTESERRISVMVEAMRRVDEEGLFGTGAARERIVINAEVMPPDSTNVGRAVALNPPAALVDWLAEAAETAP